MTGHPFEPPFDHSPGERPPGVRDWADAPMWVRVLWLAISTPRSPVVEPPDWWAADAAGNVRIGWLRIGREEWFAAGLCELLQRDVAAWEEFLTVRTTPEGSEPRG